jgi:hypothetical protein
VLPLGRLAALTLPLVALGCHDDRPLRVFVDVCGALCGDRSNLMRDVRDYSGMECATSVRVRVYAEEHDLGSGQVLAERCADLGSIGGLSAAFDVVLDGGVSGSTGVGAPIDLPGFSPNGPFSVEVALYSPGGDPNCPADAPMVGLGRSPTIDPAEGLPGSVHVALGCHELCTVPPATDVALFVKLLRIEDQMPSPSSLPASARIGETYPYAQLTSTAGICVALPSDLPPPRAEFRAFLTRMGSNGALIGKFVADQSGFSGCLAIRLGTPDGNIYGCLSIADPTTTAYTIDSEVLRKLALSKAPTDRSGSILVALLDNTGAPAAGAVVVAPGNATVSYVDASATSIDTTAVATTPSGLAIVRDAPLATYSATVDAVNFAYFTAGGIEPGSVMTLTTALP